MKVRKAGQEISNKHLYHLIEIFDVFIDVKIFYVNDL